MSEHTTGWSGLPVLLTEAEQLGISAFPDVTTEWVEVVARAALDEEATA